MNKLNHILPFMESEELKELAIKVIKKEIKGVRLMMVLPFLSREDLDEIVDMLIENKQGKELNYVLPFVSLKKIEQIYQGVINGEIDGIRDSSLYPFLGKKQLKKLFNKLVIEAQSNPESDEDDDLDIEDDELEVELEIEEIEDIEAPQAPEK